MSRAIIVAFHKYTPYGDEFYEPILVHFRKQMEQYKSEFSHLYIIDSTWKVKESYENESIICINPSLRYYDAYKEILPMVKEDTILIMDNDMVIYKNGIINETFHSLEHADVVSIYETIGKKHFPQLNGQSKFCPYWIATYKNLLMKYVNCEWGPVPWGETLSELTEFMLRDRVRVHEWKEDKSSLYFDGTIQYNENSSTGKNLGYYHIRSGSTPAYLLSEREYGNKETYNNYLKNQPEFEYLRQCAWYQYMGGNVDRILVDRGIGINLWQKYYNDFIKFHGL